MNIKILIFPVVLLLTFIAAYITLNYFNSQNKLLLNQTKNIYLPSVELSLKANRNLTEIQHSLQNAVATGNKNHIENTDTIAKSLYNLCVLLEAKIKSKNFSDLVNKYYINARAVSAEMIDGDISEELEKQIGIMLFQYNKIDSLLKSLELKSKKQALIHFSKIEKNNEKSGVYNIIIILTGFLISVLISYLYSNAMAKPIRELNYELLASEEELRQMNEELATSNDALSDTLERLKGTQLQLVQSEKMASIGTLISGIAHEINNPLNYIHGGVSVISMHLDENPVNNIEKLQPFFKGITLGVDRITNIVSGLSRFSRNVKSTTEKCDIHSIIDNCLLILHHRMSDRMIIIKEYWDERIVVIGNEGRLHQAILNVLSNADQAIENKGNINIKTEIIKNNVKITIKDTGQGIKKENIALITDAFYTTKDPGKGTGLGLSITCNIIQEHKGQLEFNSELGKGTEAIILLPILENRNSLN